MDYGALNKTPGVTPGPTLGLPKYALTVQVKDGWTVTRQGPYLSEGAGGYLVFKADDFDAAVELASRIPAGPRRRPHHRDGRFHQGHLAKSAEIDRLEAGIAHKDLSDLLGVGVFATEEQGDGMATFAVADGHLEAGGVGVERLDRRRAAEPSGVDGSGTLARRQMCKTAGDERFGGVNDYGSGDAHLISDIVENGPRCGE